MAKKKSATELLQIATTAVLALGALVGALTSLDGSLQAARDKIFGSKVPANVWWLISAVLLLVAFTVATRAFAGRSRLLKLGVFEFDAGDQGEYLKGRSEDIRNLTNVCLTHAQVNLIGESGAGKSALIRGGLIPHLSGSSIIPVYVNRWGRDWREGPRTALLHEIRRVPSLAAAEDLPAAIELARAESRKLLLIFDQFDDYQTAHAELFRTQAGTFLSADELAAANTFWRKIRDVLRSSAAHALFVTRADTAAGLECVRFADPRVYPLDRLQPTAAFELLDQLVAGTDGVPVMESPDNGWPSLRERLVRDLSEEGSILAIQMKLALKGLASLPYLTVREYERRGTLQGLEAADVEWRITNTVRLNAVTTGQALAILTAMVDRESHKTRAQSIEQLMAATPGLARDRLERILQEWETKELVRGRVNPDTEEPVWVLDHDYLSNGVLAAEARANRSSVLLHESELDYQASGKNLWRRWRTLLSPSEQMSLLRDRLRGTFRYGKNRAFAAVSLLRFAPVAILMVLVGIEAQRQAVERHRSRARAILENIGFHDENDLETKELDALWALAEAPPTTKALFLPTALGSVGSAVRLSKRTDAAVHAAIGVDHGMKDELATGLLRRIVLDAKADFALRATSYSLLNDLGCLDVEVVDAMLEADEDEEVVWLSSEQWKLLVAREAAERLPDIRDILAKRIERNEGRNFSNAVLALKEVLARGIGTDQYLRLIHQQEDDDRFLMLVGDLDHALLPRQTRTKIRDRLRAIVLKEVARTGKSDHLKRLLAGNAPPPVGMSLKAFRVASQYGSLELTPEQAHDAWVHVTLVISFITWYRPFEEVSSSGQLHEVFDAIPGEVPGVIVDALAMTLLRTSTPDRVPLWDAVFARMDDHTFAQIITRWGNSIPTEVLEKSRPERAVQLKEAYASGMTAMISAASTLSRLPATERIERFDNLKQLYATRATVLALTDSDIQAAARTARWLREHRYDSSTIDARLLAYVRGAIEKTSDGSQPPPALLDVAAQVAKQLTPSERAKTADILIRRFASDKLAAVSTLEAIDALGASALIPLPARVKKLVETADIASDSFGPGDRVYALAEHILQLNQPLPTEHARSMATALARGSEANTIPTLTELHRRAPSDADLHGVIEDALDSAKSDTSAAWAAKGLMSLPGATNQMLVDIYRKPTCLGACRVAVLELAEKRAGKKFNGDRWKFVAWAANEKLDLTKPIRRRVVTEPVVVRASFWGS